MKRIFTSFFFLFSVAASAQCWQTIYTGNAGKHAMAIKTGGSLFGWGENVNGQVGDNSFSNKLSPTVVGAFTDWKVVAPNGSHTLALRTNGELWAWGYNGYGALGDGTNTNSGEPIRIGTSTDWDTISVGAGFSHAIKKDGTLWAWGYGGYNQLGVGGGLPLFTPTRVDNTTNWKSVSAGVFSAVALKTDGTIWQWGNGSYQGAPSGVPIQIGTDQDWKIVVHGAEHNLAIKSNGSLWSWGNNLTGQLGNGYAGWSAGGLPQQIGTDNDWLMVFAGGAGSFGIKTDGSLWGWGNNSYGQLGDGTLTDKYIPTRIGSATDWKAVAAGSYHTFALKNDGTLWAAGLNDQGQLGVGGSSNTNTFTPIDCGALPVTWLGFSAVKRAEGIELKWQTASEQNAEYFDVERSNGLNGYIKIGSVKAVGNSRTVSSYSFIDQSALNGDNLYRIRQVDADRRFSYSAVRIVRMTGVPEQSLLLHPVPVKSVLKASLPGSFQKQILAIEIKSSEGRTVKQRQVKLSTGQLLEFDVSALPPGIYYLIVASKQKLLSAQFVKQ